MRDDRGEVSGTAGMACPAGGVPRVTVGRDPCVPPPPLCHSEPVRAAEQVPLGYTLAWESVLPKRETDCRVAARREASALGVLLAMTARRCRTDGTSRTPSPTGGSTHLPRRAGPMCPAARCVLTPAGHAGPALHGDSALCRWADRVVCPYRWDVEDAVPRGEGRRGRRPLRMGRRGRRVLRVVYRA